MHLYSHVRGSGGDSCSFLGPVGVDAALCPVRSDVETLRSVCEDLLGKIFGWGTHMVREHLLEGSFKNTILWGYGHGGYRGTTVVIMGDTTAMEATANGTAWRSVRSVAVCSGFQPSIGHASSRTFQRPSRNARSMSSPAATVRIAKNWSNRPQRPSLGLSRQFQWDQPNPQNQTRIEGTSLRLFPLPRLDKNCGQTMLPSCASSCLFLG